MLLTIPWCLSIFGHAVPIDDGKRHIPDIDTDIFARRLTLATDTGINLTLMLMLDTHKCFDRDSDTEETDRDLDLRHTDTQISIQTQQTYT